MMLTVLRGENKRGENELWMTATRAPQVERGETEGELAFKEEVFRAKMERITGNEVMWSRIEDATRAKNDGVVIIGARTEDGEPAIVRLGIPKKWRNKEELWEILSEGQKLKQLEEEYPYIEMNEVMVDRNEWWEVEKEINEYGMFLKTWGWKNCGC